MKPLTAFLLACLAAGTAAAAGLRVVPVKSAPVPLHREDRARERVGRLHYLGGIDVIKKNPEDPFGEISGLLVSPDGQRILAVQDFGWWLTAELVYDEAGRLTGIRDVQVAAMLGPDGKIFEREDLDAEALALAPGHGFGGDVLVAFERNHRILRYAFGTDGFDAIPTAVPVPPEMKDAPGNGGIESLGVLPDGSLIAITEQHTDDEGHARGWLGRGGVFHPLRFKGDGLYFPTDLAVLPSGDLLLLQRLFTPGIGNAMKLRHLPASSLVPGALLEGSLLAEMDPAYSIDNMEALAVRPTDSGSLHLYIASDNNRSPRQRTLLLHFSWHP